MSNNPIVKKIVEDAQKHNDKMYKEENFENTKKNWGSTIIPKECWIDLSKKYKTRSGAKVELHSIVMKNSIGNEVTFPIKGTVYTPRKGMKDKTDYAIWTLDGRASVVSLNNPDDLIEVDE